MIAKTYYEKALSNYKTAKLIYYYAKNDEEQLNIVGYHMQQALELGIKHTLAMKGVPLQKTHDIDQLIAYAKANNIDLKLPDYIIEKADVITLWETKTRYILGFQIEISRIEKMLNALDEYFTSLSNS